MKKKSLLTVLFLLAVLLLRLALPLLHPIGTVSGPELDRIVIGGESYSLRTDLPFSYADKERFLGVVIGGDIRCFVYSVKGDDGGQYLYRLWDWEGAFYERQPLPQ